MVNKGESFEMERAIGFQVNRTAYVMSEEISHRFLNSGYQLTAQDFGILFRLWKQGGLSQVQIASLMMRDKTTITRRLDALVKKQLIERKNDASDRRLFRIHLTRQGKLAVEQLMIVVAEFQREVLVDVSDAEEATTLKVLQKITAQITRRKL